MTLLAALRRMTTRLRLKASLGCGVFLFGVAVDVSASDLVASLPYRLHRGPPRGWASTEGVDWTRSYRMSQAPVPQAARVLWQTQVIGGVSCNLVVDEEGRVFAAGPGHVTQLGPDGAREYTHRTSSPGVLAATLLADGSRAVVTRDGRVSSWSPKGKTRFSLELATPPAGAHGSLLPLPDGGALVSIGRWLFALEASGAVRARTSLKRRIDHTLIAHDRAVVINDDGDVMTWDGESSPEPRGSFGGRVARVTARGPSSLVGLFSDRGLVELSLSTGERAQLTGGDKLGLMPVLTVSGNETFALMTADGSAFLQRSGAASPPNGTPRATKAEVAGDAHLLSSDDGTLVSLTSNTALRLQRDGEIQELPEIRCAHPVSLVPAGPARVVAACSSGQLWLIGPSTNVPTSDSPRL